VDFLDGEVLPRLFAGLDTAFPEFGWRRTEKGWVATSAQYTRRAFGARPDRVVCRIPAGFYVHGSGAQSWVSFAANDPDPRGRVFVEAVRDLARRAGAGELPAVGAAVSDARRARWEERERKSRLLGALWERAFASLRGAQGAAARRYLESERGLSSEEIARAVLGWIPEDPSALAAWAREIGVSSEALIDLGLLRAPLPAARYGPSAWSGRLVGLVRDLAGRVVNLWGRAIRPDAQPKYLYLRGCERRAVGAVGLFEATVQSKVGRDDLVLVEGVFDVVALAARGFPCAAALGGSARELDEPRIQALGLARVSSVTLALDADEEGWRGFDQLVDRWGRVAGAPALFAVDPDLYGGAKDPDALVRRDGLAAFAALVASAEPAHDLWVRRRLADPAGAGQPATPKARLAAADRLLTLRREWRGPQGATARYRLLAGAAALLEVPIFALKEDPS